MDKDFTTILKYSFENFTDYGKIPTTKQEFMNKFEPYEYKVVLQKILEDVGYFEEKV